MRLFQIEYKSLGLMGAALVQAVTEDCAYGLMLDRLIEEYSGVSPQMWDLEVEEIHQAGVLVFMPLSRCDQEV